MTELAAPQISSLMEALPGIAAVLRSPVANAMVAICRAGVGLEEYQLAHAEELLRYGVRRNLLTQEEVDKVLSEVREIVSKRPGKPIPPPEPRPKKPVVVAAPAAMVVKAPPAQKPKTTIPPKAPPAKPAPKVAAKAVPKAKMPPRKAEVVQKKPIAIPKGRPKPAVAKRPAKKGTAKKR